MVLDVPQWEPVDERDATAELLNPWFRVTFVRNGQHDTYRVAGPLAEVRNWIREFSDGREYTLFVEIPREYNPTAFLLARIDGDFTG